MSDPRDLLPEYALDMLSPEAAASVEDYLKAHPDARAEVDALREGASELAAALTAVAPSPSTRDRLMASVAADGRFARFTDAMAKMFDVTADRAAQLLELVDYAGSWVEGPGPSRLVHFEGGPAVASADNGFVHIPADTDFPRHEHLGREVSLILQGSATDDQGKTYRPGDLVVLETGSSHSFRSSPGEPLIFAVSVAGIRFDS